MIDFETEAYAMAADAYMENETQCYMAQADIKDMSLALQEIERLKAENANSKGQIGRLTYLLDRLTDPDWRTKDTYAEYREARNIVDEWKQEKSE